MWRLLVVNFYASKDKAPLTEGGNRQCKSQSVAVVLFLILFNRILSRWLWIRILTCSLMTFLALGVSSLTVRSLLSSNNAQINRATWHSARFQLIPWALFEALMHKREGREAAYSLPLTWPVCNPALEADVLIWGISGWPVLVRHREQTNNKVHTAYQRGADLSSSSFNAVACSTEGLQF